MNYTQDMNLLSTSGYCMPFEEKDRDVQLTLRYGKQKHPKTGESFFHHGIDFKTNNYFLAAVADGVVSGIGIDRKQYGLYVVIKYSKYEVTYSHMSNVFMQFGQQVKAGLAVGVSSDLLHMEVKYDGEEIDPVEFITMLYGNAKTWSEKGKAQPEFVAIDMDVHTDYDKDKDEIEKLMMRFFANYMNDLHEGLYSCPQRTEQSLRHLFSAAAMKDYFYESIPSMVNPLGIGRRSMPLVSKVQNLLIGDFLNYMALRHQIFLSTMTSLEKKKLKSKPYPTEY
ncbi:MULTISPECIES: M23 family metallopeptidase [Bacteroidales]|uniref:M23 family metallopeptidase n=1 Tax=Bacteroidales TaxID=171549 RepID=UPI0020180A86|nr:M23 family metallopeptidase [Parabacteroides leei]MCL3854217.1 M23 family metallopeptidase [Parabacteroides leei]NCB72205.1 M23 family metallopeptidase [Clostridia bacterium]